MHDLVEEDESRACSTYVRNKKHTKIRLENLEGKGHMGDIGIDGRIILKGSLSKV
jgi:hypothetical protein